MVSSLETKAIIKLWPEQPRHWGNFEEPDKKLYSSKQICFELHLTCCEIIKAAFQTNIHKKHFPKASTFNNQCLSILVPTAQVGQASEIDQRKPPPPLWFLQLAAGTSLLVSAPEWIPSEEPWDQGFPAPPGSARCLQEKKNSFVLTT